MVLGIKELHRLVKEKSLVANLSERELENPEGAGFDLRIGEIYEISGQGFLGVTERETPEMILVAKYEEEKIAEVLLNRIVLSRTGSRNHFMQTKILGILVGLSLFSVQTARAQIVSGVMTVTGVEMH